MQILIRADASSTLGAGHIVRCATLGHQLVRTGHVVSFVCRSDPGNLNAWLESEGFEVIRLPSGPMDENADAHAVKERIGQRQFDWLVVDHYLLGLDWERQLASTQRSMLVIDDVARPHACDLLLDQNALNSQHGRYPGLLPAHGAMLLGPRFALVRDEFSALRKPTLADRANRTGRLERLLVCMGASDPENETCKVLAGLATLRNATWHVDVVVGAGNPHRVEVEQACELLPNATLHVQTQRMAELMAAADCAINAGGSTTWERCTLGLPGIVAILAENQAEIARVVHQAGAQRCLGWNTDVRAEDYAQAIAGLTADCLRDMSSAAARICDGQGAARVGACLIQ